MESRILMLIKSKKGKSSKDAILDIIRQDQSAIDELMQYFFSDDLRTCQYASWPVGFVSDEFPDILRPYIGRMLEAARNPKHNAILRNTMRTLERCNIPEELEGEVYDFCYERAADVNQPIAVRVFGMGVCTNLAEKYPELKEEIIPILMDIHPEASPGTKHRAKACLNRLQQL